MCVCVWQAAPQRENMVVVVGMGVGVGV